MTNGLLLVDKPGGITSFEVVRRARRALGIRKIGHLGTLDPFATGLLPLCLGEATKLVPFLMGHPKSYRATLKLGVATDTQDLTGRVIAISEALPPPEAVVRAASRFVGDIEQVPPLYSALHHQGERLYRLARRGEAVTPMPRPVVIHALEVEDVLLPLATIRVTCSAGTYIRTLAADIGKVLGCGAHLIALRRLAVGDFSVEQALGFAALEAGLRPEEMTGAFIPLAESLPGMRPVAVAPEEARRLREGRPLSCPGDHLLSGERVRVVTDRDLVAVAQVERTADHVRLTPLRVFSRWGSQGKSPFGKREFSGTESG